MARTCSACSHPNRDAIDRALVDGVPLRDIQGQHRVSRSTLSRHRADHIPAALVAAQEAHEAAQADTLLDQVRALQGRAQRILDRAEGAGDLPTALKAIRELRGVLELLARLEGELHDAPNVNVTVGPQWPQIAMMLMRALAPFPDARVAAADALAELEHHAPG